MRFGQDVRVWQPCPFRSWALWFLGYPNASLADADQALRDAREIGHAATLMFAPLALTPQANFLSANYATAIAANDELLAVADEKNAWYWKAVGMVLQGNLFAVTDKASDAIQKITSGLTAFRSTGATLYVPSWLSSLARACADVGKLDDAWSCIGEAMTAIETTKQRWCRGKPRSIAWREKSRCYRENRMWRKRKIISSGRSRLHANSEQNLGNSPRRHEPRTPLSRPAQVEEARELLAPVYGWFTEGFDTRDLKEAKALLRELAA